MIAHPALSVREREVCILTLLGLRPKEIGARLVLSPRTVEEYRFRMFKKYGVKTTVQFMLKLYGETE